MKYVYTVVNKETALPLPNKPVRLNSKGKNIALKNNVKNIINRGSDHLKSDHLNETSHFEIIYKKIPGNGNNKNLLSRKDLKLRNIHNCPAPFSNNIIDKLTETVNPQAAITDITESEIMIKKTEEKYLNLFEHASDAIIIFSFDGTIHEFNNITCTMSGYSKEAFALLNISDIIVGDLNISLQKYRAMRGGKSIIIYRQFITRDGLVLNMEIKTKLLEDGNILAFGRDLTERNKSEEETKRAIERYEILSKATSDTIWDWDIKNDSMIYNDGISKMFGYLPGEIDTAANWWKKNIHPDDKAPVTLILNNTFNDKKQTVQVEYRYRCADDSYKNILDRAFVVYDEAGVPIRMIGAMQDVTKEKEYERHIAITIFEAQEKERLELGMELHDNVNQLLSATLLYLAMAKKDSKAGNEVSQTLNNCTEYINSAINDIRNLSHRLTPFTKGEISLKDVIELMIEPMQKTNQFEINLQVDDFTNTTVNSDIQTNLYRIIQEQMTNILKYAYAGKVDIKIWLINETIKLSISDNGIGFNAKTIKAGIGLENIKRRTALFSGIFVLNTSPGKGCELAVEIPLH